MGKSKISVEVAYALPNKQAIVPVDVEAGCSVYDTVLQSGIDRQFAGLDLDNAKART